MEILKMLAIVFALAPILGLTWIIVRPLIYVIAYPTFVGLQYLEQMLPIKEDSFLILKKPKRERHRVAMDLFGSIATLQSLIIVAAISSDIMKQSPITSPAVMNKLPGVTVIIQIIAVGVVYWISTKYGESNTLEEESDWFQKMKKFKIPPAFKVLKDDEK